MKDFDEECYIPRKIGLIQIKDKLFKEAEKLENHSFIIEGKTVGDVRKFLIQKNVDENKIGYANVITNVANKYKFIILEPNKAKKQFERIFQIYKDYSVHWLKLNDNEALWVCSRISLTAPISSLTIKDKDGEYAYIQTYFVSETTFLQHVAENSMIVIAAQAGMGKSTVLTSLTKAMQNDKIKKWILRIDLNLHTKTLNEIKTDSMLKSKKIKLDFDKDNQEYADVILKLLHKNQKVTKDNITVEQRLFKHLFENGKLCIVFDGFDEISPEYETSVMDLLYALKQKNQVWVTSRLNFKATLEGKLQSLAYDLKPINEEEQKHFLFKYWKNKSKGNDNNIKYYAKQLVKEFNRKIEHNNLFGIPLQTLMLAEIFEENKDNISTRNKWQGCFDYDRNITAASVTVIDDNCERYIRSEEGFLHIQQPPWYPRISEKLTNLFKLYEDFVEKKISDYLGNKGKMVLTNKVVKQETKRTIASIHRIYSILGLFRLANETDISEIIRMKEIDDANEWKKAIQNGEKNEGIIDQIMENGETIFNHLTYAEYFAAFYLKNKLKKEENTTAVFKIIDSIFQHDVPLFKYCINFFLVESKNNIVFRISSAKTKMMHFFAHEGLLNCFKYYIKKGYNITEKDNKGKTVLHYATANRKTNVVYFILLHAFNILAEERKPRKNVEEELKKFKGIVPLVKVREPAEEKQKINFVLCHLMWFVNLLDNDQKNALDYETDCDISIFLKDIVKAGANSVKPKSFDASKITGIFGYRGYCRNKSPAILNHVSFKTILNIFTSAEKVDLNLLTDNYESEQKFPFMICERRDLTLENKNQMFQSIYGNIHNKENSWIVGAILLDASENNHIDVFKYFFEKERKYVTKDLFIDCFSRACKFNAYDIVKFLQPADSSFLYDINALQIALKETKNVEIIKYIISQNTNQINSADVSGEYPLHKAIQHAAQLYIVKFMLSKGADPYKSDSHSKTAWHYAVESCNEAVINHFFGIVECWPEWTIIVWRYYHDRNFDINEKMNGENLLHRAINAENTSLIKFWLKNEIEVNAKNKDGKTPLHYACEKEMMDVVKLLFENGASYNEPDNNNCPPSSNNKEIQDLLDKMPVQFKRYEQVIMGEIDLYNIEATDKEGRTAWHKVITNRNNHGYATIKSFGSKLKNKQDVDGNTPLHLAAKHGYKNSVMQLLQNRVIFNIQNNDDKTALDLAKENGHSEIVKELLRIERLFNELKFHVPGKSYILNDCKLMSGAAKVTDKEGKTLLHYAVVKNNIELAECLICHRAKVNVTDIYNQTPLCYAVKNNFLEMTKLLLKYGAMFDMKRVNRLNSNSCKDVLEKINTAFDYISQRDFVSFKEFVENTNLNMDIRIIINAKNCEKQTMIQVAQYFNMYDAVKYLLQNGATLKETNSDQYEIGSKKKNIVTSIRSIRNLISDVQLIFKTVKAKNTDGDSIVNYLEQNDLRDIITNVYWKRFLNNDHPWKRVSHAEKDKDQIHRCLPKTLLQEAIIAEENAICQWLTGKGAKNDHFYFIECQKIN
jgi:ankyrin repeat protein